MKPTAQQQAVAELISEQGKFWMVTNDISSPTHSCDIEESINLLQGEGIIEDKQAAVLDTKLHELLALIRNL